MGHVVHNVNFQHGFDLLEIAFVCDFGRRLVNNIDLVYVIRACTVVMSSMVCQLLISFFLSSVQVSTNDDIIRRGVGGSVWRVETQRIITRRRIGVAVVAVGICCDFISFCVPPVEITPLRHGGDDSLCEWCRLYDGDAMNIGMLVRNGIYTRARQLNNYVGHFF
jgi:hypothetical protein